jgi:hypothetical protein
MERMHRTQLVEGMRRCMFHNLVRRTTASEMRIFKNTSEEEGAVDASTEDVRY